MEGIDTNLTDEEALKNFLLDIDCLNELQDISICLMY